MRRAALNRHAKLMGSILIYLVIFGGMGMAFYGTWTWEASMLPKQSTSTRFAPAVPN